MSLLKVSVEGKGKYWAVILATLYCYVSVCTNM